MKSKLLALGLLLLATQLTAQWNPFGTGIGGNIFVIGFQPYEGDLLAYTYPAPVPFVWDGISQWITPIPQVPNAGGIHRLFVADSIMYAATYSVGQTNQFYKYDGGGWVQMGLEFSNPGASAYPSIYDIAVYQDTLYICGEFTLCGTDTISYVAKWSDSSWVAVGQGLSGAMAPFQQIKYPHSMLVYNGELVVAGNFTMAGGTQVNGIARWNGTTWSGFGDGFNKVVYGMCEHNGDLFAGGEFTLADSNATTRIARWNGTNWDNPGIGVTNSGLPGLSPYVHTLISHQGRLVVAGGFNRVLQGASTLTGKGVFIWDGTNIDLMDGGVNGDVEAVMPYQSGLLIGGDFNLAGGSVNVNQVAYYDFITSASSGRDLGIKIYPSLTKEMVRIDWDNTRLQGKTSVRIIDMLGIERYHGELQESLNLSALATGTYFVQVLEEYSIVHTQVVQKVH